MISQWIWAPNLRPFLVSLGWFVDYDFDSDDWIAIEHGVATS